MDIIKEIKDNLPNDLRKYIIYEYALPNTDIIYYQCITCKIRFYLTGQLTLFVPYRNLDDIIEQMNDETGEHFYYCECKKCRNESRKMTGEEFKNRQLRKLRRRKYYYR